MSFFDYDITTYNQDSQYKHKKRNTSASAKYEAPLFDGYFKLAIKSPLDEFSFTPFLHKKEKITVPKVGNVKTPFGEKTEALLYKQKHKTHLLDVAQQHLGIQEVTPDEYSKLSPEERNNTQMHLIGKYGTSDHQWCAHTVSHIAKEAGMNIGKHKKAVLEFVNWGNQNNIYKPIKTNDINFSNYIAERDSRESQIKKQIKNMHEGDFIIWKSSFVANLPNNRLEKEEASHIGILESVNPDGTITVIEGNANEYKTDVAEREMVSLLHEGINGNQNIGEFKEVNRRDGLIRKTYTAEDLAAFGYSGYIDTQKLVK